LNSRNATTKVKLGKLVETVDSCTLGFGRMRTVPIREGKRRKILDGKELFVVFGTIENNIRYHK
jgi:hypothetical protein